RALALGIAFGMVMRTAANKLGTTTTVQYVSWTDGLILGVRMSATYMGYVVLARVAAIVLGEIVAIRFRRLYAIAKLSVIESNRRMWAPWVVITVFLV